MTWDSLDTLARLRDLKLVQRAERCVHDAAWQRQPVFVAWFAEWLTRPLRWGGSCICHVTECEAGEAVECIEKGRLLPLARAYSERCFQSGLVVEDAPARASSSSSSSSSSGSSDSDSRASPGGASVDGDEPAPAGVVLPDEIEGIRWAVERRGTPGEGYRVRCALHPGCRAFRASHIDVSVLGAKAAFYYLGSWLRKGEIVDADTHRTWRPKRNDVRGYAATADF